MEKNKRDALENVVKAAVKLCSFTVDYKLQDATRYSQKSGLSFRFHDGKKSQVAVYGCPAALRQSLIASGDAREYSRGADALVVNNENGFRRLFAFALQSGF